MTPIGEVRSMVADALTLANRAWPDPDRVPEAGASVLALLWIADRYLDELVEAESAGRAAPRMPLLVARQAPWAPSALDGLPDPGPSDGGPVEPVAAGRGASARGHR